MSPYRNTQFNSRFNSYQRNNNNQMMNNRNSYNQYSYKSNNYKVPHLNN